MESFIYDFTSSFNQCAFSANVLSNRSVQTNLTKCYILELHCFEFLTCGGVIKYYSLNNFKQSKEHTQIMREGILAFESAHISRSMIKFQTCDLGSEPLLNTELPIEYARSQAASICETHCLYTHRR
jgi:hypothetical protein